MSEIYKSIRESDNLDLALNYALTKITNAIEGRDDDLHILNLVTVDEKNIPNTRNVVIRDFSEENLNIRFHTDKRSTKISDIKNNNKISLLGYERKDKLQIRFDAEATIIDSDEFLLDIWKGMYPMSRECYRVIESPGSKIKSLEDIKFEEEDDQGLNGFENFVAVSCDIQTIEILYLHHAGHLRASYTNNNGKLNGEWIVP
ncbi:MAG: pyridoxamine 5'-phosphate oxidase family protein [Pseudomonadota bacterium]|nr:pyridoxamine 5'-phosphate oxidase family protein [Pseudomonadota bacterium]